MKKTLVLVLVSLLLFYFPFYSPLKVEADESETWIVIVGHYDFLYDTYYTYVTLRQYYNADPETNIKYLYQDPFEEIEYGSIDNGTTKENVRWTIREWLKIHSDEDDTVFIYFGCHGGGAYANGTLESGRIDLSGDEGYEHYNGTWFGVDECLWLNWEEQYWDDELREDLAMLSYRTLIVMLQGCKTVNASCFTGGFIDDLSAPNRIIITSSNETSPSYGDLDGDGFAEFSAVFFDALFGYDTWMSYNVLHIGQPVDADSNNDGRVSILEAWEYAYNNDYARWAVRTQNGTLPDPEEENESRDGYIYDETPWFDNGADGLPTFKAGYDIYLLGDFNFDGKVDGKDWDLFLCAFKSDYHPLYDLDDDGDVDGMDAFILISILKYCETRTLTISTAYGGTTDPAPGTYGKLLNQMVTVTAIPNSQYDWEFYYWLLDGSTYYQNPINVTMDADHTLTAYFKSSGGGGDNAGCPTLFVWNGSNYVDYGVIDIHNPTGEDVTREVLVKAEDVGISNRKVKFRLREGWEGLNFSESVIDQVKLYAVDIQGNRYLCPLIKATHSIEGNVLSQLLQSDDYKVQILLLETIDLTFIVPYQNVQGFTFTIEGCNYFKM
jgi:hypothetical protein